MCSRDRIKRMVIDCSIMGFRRRSGDGRAAFAIECERW
jgi:hypothetical protein